MRHTDPPCEACRRYRRPLARAGRVVGALLPGAAAVLVAVWLVREYRRQGRQ